MYRDILHLHKKLISDLWWTTYVMVTNSLLQFFVFSILSVLSYCPTVH